MARVLIVLSCLMLAGPSFAEQDARRQLDNMCCFDDWWLNDPRTGFEGWDYGVHRTSRPYPRWCGVDEYGFIVCHY